eukprot:CAMPEP_0172888280 /NCGR_PEP_ID=MMETSP1075-20121228/135992_1 /TAXON_ID=2916 /ORGANISM="Ceratium fusus, Strain PA161109" /LENGTH=62 /DNA_ID=CAMNT_0013742117 /DNA_START=83 /DNA_END=268 /DNA_ORIENTATION=+
MPQEVQESAGICAGAAQHARVELEDQVVDQSLGKQPFSTSKDTHLVTFHIQLQNLYSPARCR